MNNINNDVLLLSSNAVVKYTTAPNILFFVEFFHYTTFVNLIVPAKLATSSIF
jgi:hypothetical protein